MKASRMTVVVCLLLLASTTIAAAGPEPKRGSLGQTQKAELFCPPTALAIGGRIIKPELCYVPVIWRTNS
jgi:hypothetical protein